MIWELVEEFKEMVVEFDGEVMRRKKKEMVELEERRKVGW